ncbi:hypothetical protein DFR58_13710 [Anaerobacterium chartisolvens]|uniref:YqeG family HAD IIIA-type phosphatase n=1 Tax=Anaerobacterium chartisolvens TaxID=1297424 RepID=A0A369ALY9_9FIRM|nr:YqeG family HAD IIIA-type phosphatase [Anaerobacterium chartisolvens]RCX09296.1 hypothetical protein DFR58_13710 [Anaerobacterium chartisolvens]
MFEKFYPDLMLDGVWDIDLDSLQKKGIKGLILDIDNTLVPQYTKEADENAVKWIERVKNSGFKICIVSNASKKRVLKFNDSISVLTVHRASKPGTAAFKKAARLMGIELCESAVVGDQIFTDIYGGNRAGAFTILVKPIDKREFIFVRLKRIPEKLVLRKYKKSTKGS